MNQQLNFRTKRPAPFKFVFLALLYVAVASSWAQSLTSAQPILSRATIPFRWTPGQIEVQVSVNGNQPVWFIVDTGAEFSILDRQFANSIHLQTFRLGERDFGRGVSLKISDIELTDQKVMILPLDNFRRQGRTIVGLIGYDFFAKYVVTFDYAARSLQVYDSDSYVAPHTAKSLALSFADRLSFVPVAFRLPDGSRLVAKAILDTGASQALILRYPFADSHALLDRARQYQATVAGSAETGTVKFLQLPVEAVLLGGCSFPNTVLRIYGQPSGAGGFTQTDGALGNEILSRFRVTVDYPHKLLHLEPNPGTGCS